MDKQKIFSYLESQKEFLVSAILSGTRPKRVMKRTFRQKLYAEPWRRPGLQ